MPIHVLVCDDSKFARLQLREILEREGYEVAAEAANGDEAVHRYKQVHPDLVLMDLAMPIKDGVTATREILEYDPEALVVVCSALGHREAVAEAILGGARDFILKPIIQPRVVAALERQLIRRRREQEEGKISRRHQRFSLQDLRVRYRPLDSHEWLDGVVENISAGGVLLRPRAALPEGTHLLIELSGPQHHQNIMSLGRTVWGDSPAGKFPDRKYGVEFVELTKGEQAKLQAFIKSFLV